MNMNILTGALLALCVYPAARAETAPASPAPTAAATAQADEPMPNFEVFLATLDLAKGQVGAPKNISGQPGYDNQPAFFQDNKALLYISDRGGQNDVFRYDIQSARTSQVTATKEAEYSPVPLADGSGFSVIRVATPNAQGADATNPPLWRYNNDGTPGESLIDVTSIGYYAWIDKSHVALFVVGDEQKQQPNSLVLADLSTGKTTLLANSPGRRLARAPDGRVSFVDQSDARHWVISAIAAGDKTATALVAMPVGTADEQEQDFSEDYAWLPDGSILMAKGSTLLRWDGKPGSGWLRFAEVPNLDGDIKRLAVSKDGKHVALVVQMNHSAEAAIVAHVNKDHQRSMALLKEAVDINSGTMNFAGVRKVGAVFEREFKDLGFTTQWIDGKPFNRAGHLLAQYGTRGPKILLIGHLDTVFAEDSPLQKMQVLSAGKASGPGITDMKGGDVIIVHALRALRDSGQLNNLSIRVVLTGDEENSGDPSSLSKQALLEAGEWADIALGFEDGDGDPKTAAISRRGASGWQLEVKAKPAHSSQIFQPNVGDGAIFEAARILDGFRVALSTQANLSFNPGVIVGGTDITLDEQTSRGTAFGKGNVIAQTLRVSGDLRAISPEQLDLARQTMRKIVEAHLPGASASIKFDEGYPPMAPTEGNKKLLAIYSGVSEDYGFGPVIAINPRNAGAADISFVANKVEMALDGIGLMGSGGHTVDEVADLNTLDSQTIRAAITLYRLSQPH